MSFLLLASALALASSSGGTGDLVHYFNSRVPGGAPTIIVDWNKLCSPIGESDIKRQFASGQKIDRNLAINRVEVSCASKKIKTYWSAPSGHDAFLSPDYIGTTWTQEACFRHEVYFIAQSEWKVVEYIDLPGYPTKKYEATCAGFPFLSTDI